PGETASVFLPSVPVLLGLASEMEAQRDHVLGKPHRESDGLDDALLIDANKQKDEPGEDEKAFESLHADAELDQVIFDGASFGTATFAGSDEESDYLGLPGLLDADQVRALLRKRQAEQVSDRTSAAAGDTPAPMPPPRPASENLHALRKELNGLVAMHHHRTGKPHGMVHNELRTRLGGPPTAMASADQLRERIAALREWR
ncbi:ATP-dependent helicase, partial [Streptomyces sp. SID10244]|nr:ATP-dependent helicase [Streptomyces sp. SID10244]